MGFNVDLLALAKRVQRMHPEYDADTALCMVVEYKRFMILKIKEQDCDATVLSPSRMVDIVWHAHVLDTKAYASFCAKSSEGFIHHNPDGDLDEARPARYAYTLKLYKSCFTVDPPSQFWGDDAPPLAEPSSTQSGRKRAAPVNEKITIGIIAFNGKVQHFKLHRNESLAAVFRKWYQSNRIKAGSHRFLYDARRVGDDCTPDDLHMEDGDQIDAILESAGC